MRFFALALLMAPAFTTFLRQEDYAAVDTYMEEPAEEDHKVFGVGNGHCKGIGKGHEFAKGKGHHKERRCEEEDDHVEEPYAEEEPYVEPAPEYDAGTKTYWIL